MDNLFTDIDLNIENIVTKIDKQYKEFKETEKYFFEIVNIYSQSFYKTKEQALLKTVEKLIEIYKNTELKIVVNDIMCV